MAFVIPLLIILFLVILLVKRSSFSLRHNIQFWLTAGYILLLFVSPVLLQMLPVENLADMKMKTVSEKDLVNHGDLFGKAFEGRPEQSEGAFVLKQWEFPFSGSLINVVMLPKHEQHEEDVNIVAERKDRADGKIEAVSYATKTIVELFDFSERMMPHRITLDGNVLKVEAPECLKVELGMFSREFVVSQILGESEVSTPEHQSTGGSPVIIPGPGLDSGNMSEHDSRTTPGEQLLYLRIPADVDVQSKNPITFVEGGVRLE
jgi:hypothetical protein